MNASSYREGIIWSGADPRVARGVCVALHGRGGDAQGICSVVEGIVDDDIAIVSPQAPGRTWYPESFLAPLDRNEPQLSAALGQISHLMHELSELEIPMERVALLGFSQGACLALEWFGRTPMRCGGVIALSGGRIGPPGTVWEGSDSFEGTPIFLGASDPDPHVPFERVRETEAFFLRFGADVVCRRYPGAPHTIHHDELVHASEILAAIRR